MSTVTQLYTWRKVMATKAKPKKLRSLGRVKKLSTLLTIGLRDLAKQERAKNCVVDMSNWWLPRKKAGEDCSVCLAGAVMKYGLLKPKMTDSSNGELWPEDYDEETSKRLYALNAIRQGFVSDAANCLQITTDVPNRLVSEYGEDPNTWRSQMKQVIKELRADGQ